MNNALVSWYWCNGYWHINYNPIYYLLLCERVKAKAPMLYGMPIKN